MNIEAESVNYHRNGVSGEPFYAILFRAVRDDAAPADRAEPLMLGVVFREQSHVAVFNAELVGEGNVRFFENSFRGDQFEDALRAVLPVDSEFRNVEGRTL